MGKFRVDQIGRNGELITDFDAKLSEPQKNSLLLQALSGAEVNLYCGQRVVRYENQVILKAQVTYLGNPWEPYKKRIQIPRRWVDVHSQALKDGLVPRFIGIYHYEGTTIFVDFAPDTYVLRKANNSAAHVATNDLFQAQTLGLFSRTDRNGNCLTSVRADVFADYLVGRVREKRTYIDVFAEFNAEFLGPDRIEALEAVQEMYKAQWPDTMQGEWPGFYLEYRLDEFLRRSKHDHNVAFQKMKTFGSFDYDLVFKQNASIYFYGDLKASNITTREAPGNDADDIERCLDEYGRFWYVIYEHETWHSRDEGDLPVMAWNEWRKSVGHSARKTYNPLSYARRFKSAVRFSRMQILEVNTANIQTVLGSFKQGRQPSGAARALKVMINKKNIDNFLIFSASVDALPLPGAH